VGPAIPSTENLGDLPSFPTPKGTNEPRAILAAWTALEALSPQTYRRPEALAAGDRRCVADLSAGRVPWSTGERSKVSSSSRYSGRSQPRVSLIPTCLLSPRSGSLPTS
jgi:hypothetical protein